MKLNLPKKLRNTVLLKLIIYFVLTISITLCASSYFTYRYFSSYFKSEITHINQKVLNQLSVFSDDFILKKINELIMHLIINNLNDNYIKNFLNATSYDSECLLNVNRQLNNLVFQNMDMIDSILVYSKDSKFLAGTKFIKYIDPETNGKSLEFDWINTFLDSGKSLLWLKTRNTIVYSDSLKFAGDVITVICSYPLSSKGEDMKGCIAMNIKEQALNNYLAKFNSLNKGQLIIIDNTGAVISHSNSSKLYEDISHELFIEQIINTKNPGDFISEYGGREYVISYTPSSLNNWIYISMLPSELYYQQDYIIKKNLIIISIIILLFVFILTDIFSYKLYVPLKKVIDRYTPGNPNIASFNSNINEYKLLDNLFSNMSDKISDLQGTLDENALLIRHNFLMGLLSSHKTDTYDNNDYMNFLNITFQKKYFLVSVLIVSKKLISINRAGDLLFIKYRIIEFINSQGQESIVLQPVDTDVSTVAVIFNTDSAGSEETEKFITEVKDFCFNNFSFCPVIGVGRVYENIDSINRSYAEAKISIQYRFLYPGQNIFYYEDASNAATEEIAAALKDFEDKIDKYLKLENIDKLEETLRKIPLFIAGNKVPYIQAKKGILSIAALFMAYAAAKNINLRELLGDSFSDRLRNSENIYEYIEILLQYTISIYDYLSDKKLNKNSELVETVKQYIINNLHMEISLNSTAEAFSISPFYLSKIFKEKTGYNYIDYVVVCKMNKAKELLASTGKSLGKITAQVGYTQVSYFSRKFKECTGMTPVEYRKKMHDKG